ncbi:nicotinamide riboside transporter PnuC [Opitutaceae bacterium]
MSMLEIAGTVLGVLGVWLMIRQNIWGWPVGLVQVALYAWIFFGARLYSDAILQLIFFGLQLYGWWHWARARRDPSRVTPELPVTRLAVSTGAMLGVAGLAGTLLWGEFMRRTTDAALPHWDAFILVFSLIAQWLQARKVLECWLGWIIVNLVAVGVYWVKDLRLTTGLYIVFLGMAVWGWRAWRASEREREVRRA